MAIVFVGINVAANVFAVHDRHGRLFTASGHTIRLIAPKFVMPYRAGLG
ncbi:MAG: hypothetical protein M9884_17505 [Rhodocyclaceae bacterium]|nr:hypothetical protein [Rhodocyclaceae bacterium]